MKGQVLYLKEQENHYKKRRVTLENSMKNLKERMIYALGYLGLEKVRTDSFSFSISESSSWSVDTDELSEAEKKEWTKLDLGSNEFKVSVASLRKYFELVPEENLPMSIKISRKKGIRVR